MRQIWMIVQLNIVSLRSRIWMSLAAVIAIAAVVAVLLGFLSMANGFQKTLQGSGSENLAVVTRIGSESEINSIINKSALELVRTAPGIARDANNRPIVSGELYVIVDGLKKGVGTKANLPLRGLDPTGLSMRENVNLVAGRLFETGKNEIVVGAGILQEFDGFDLGQEIRFGKNKWTIVGIFSAGGSAFESELWADAKTIQSQFRREGSIQSARLALEKPGDVSLIQAYFDKDPRLNLEVRTEKAYFENEALALNYIVLFGWGLSIAMAAGSLAGALNTMYASVDARARDIATLRTIGFSGTATFIGTVIESLFLSLTGGVLGALAAFFFLDGLSTSTLGSSFTQVVFKFDLSPEILVNAGQIALMVGLLGGVFPAFKASRMSLAKAFQD